ncbi:MAG: hypothetical protein K0Q56_1897 [Sporolactobacillus laevolacticus]|jgi:hypothetical protein|nr:hypothetical protein [Sporolactobacillus laevolacticus]
MEVSPYSNTHMPVNPGNVGNIGNVGNVGNAGNVANVGAISPMPATKPEYKPAYKFPSPGKGKGKGAMPSPYGPKAGVGAGKVTENTLHCPPTQGGTIYDPESVNVQHIYKPVIVKHIHKMRTVRKTHYIYEHQHYYPHTMSETCDERHYDVQCEKPFFPKPYC